MARICSAPGAHADMPYDIAADTVVLIHFLFIIYALLGGLLLLRWPGTAWLHIPAACWAAVVVLAGWTCPLTPLEQWLRAMAGTGGYRDGFVAHYILPLIYPPGLTRGVQIALGVTLLALNAAIYTLVWRRRSGG